MERELIINTTPTGAEIALLEDKQLVEIHRDSFSSRFNVGDLYLGRVKKITPGLNACFVDVGFERDAFLHYTDLNPQFKSIYKYTKAAQDGRAYSMDKFQREPDIVKTGKINNVISKSQHILVQIIKEPIQTKGPRLSCEISLPGRYLVLTPFNEVVGVSRKIASGEERKRLQKAIEQLRPKGFGVIIRTVAENVPVQKLHDDLNNLVNQWKEITNRLQSAQAPQLIFSESKKTNTLLRDVLNDSFNRVVVNDNAIQTEVKDYIRRISPGSEKMVLMHSGPKSVFEQFGVTRQIKGLFGRTVNMDSGAYLIIEHTEALHVIDVNSGNKSAVKGDQEANAVSVNMEAAREIARQLRLRDLGGIIIVDFIDMKNPENKKAVYNALKNAMAGDRAKHTILPISKFGVAQITRQRVRPEVNISTAEVCPTCNGTGKIEASILLLEDIERKLKHLVTIQNLKAVNLMVHPYVAAYLKKGWFFRSLYWQWRRTYKVKLKVTSSDDFHYMEYRFFDLNEGEINVE
ncbi:MAG TPA: Rne/Rng family ribonuclease [Chitinophagales bacterium]|nr:Rne/Rng family ribonuclease [Chitinophagales bacterium]